MTIKVLFCRPGQPLVDQQTAGRAELLSTSFRDYERRVREQLTEMFAATGFDAKRDVAGIVLNRWGHAYCSPQPGFFFGKDGQPAPREILRRAPFGRIAFANTDLSGIPATPQPLPKDNVPPANYSTASQAWPCGKTAGPRSATLRSG